MGSPLAALKWVLASFWLSVLTNGVSSGPSRVFSRGGGECAAREDETEAEDERLIACEEARAERRGVPVLGLSGPDAGCR